jgi:hypothetical protein
VPDARGVRAQRPQRIALGHAPAGRPEVRAVPQLEAPAPEGQPPERQLVHDVVEGELLDDHSDRG